MTPNYTLQAPFSGRRNNETVQFTELPLPELVTVGMMRKLKPSTSMLFAHDFTELCAKLGPHEAAKLETPDAVGYMAAAIDLLTPAAEAGFDIPEIRPYKSLLQKITVDVNHPVEFVAQVLQHSGMARADIDAMDYRAFAPAVQIIVEIFPGPKN